MSLVDLTPAAFAAVAAAVFLGAMLQRLAGQGYGMVAAPVTALVAPQHLPATILLLGLAVGASALSMDLRAVDWREAWPGFAGRALGAGLGAVIAVALTDRDGFGLVVALIILAAIGLAISGWRARITPLNLVVAGTTAGVMGTVVAVGAPPMAILYANEAAVRSRAMQNLFFGWGMIWSIGALAVAGLIDRADLALTLALSPVAALGLVAARPMAARAAGWPMRPVALSIAGLAALILLGRSL